MKKIIKTVMLIMITLCTISLVSCRAEEAVINKEKLGQEKYSIQVLNHIQDINKDYDIDGVICYELEGNYIYRISLDYYDYYNYEMYSKTIFVKVDSDDNLECSVCGDYNISNEYMDFRDNGNYIPINLDYVPDYSGDTSDTNNRTPDFLQEIIDWFKSLFS